MSYVSRVKGGVRTTYYSKRTARATQIIYESDSGSVVQIISFERSGIWCKSITAVTSMDIMRIRLTFTTENVSSYPSPRSSKRTHCGDLSRFYIGTRVAGYLLVRKCGSDSYRVYSEDLETGKFRGLDVCVTSADLVGHPVMYMSTSETTIL